jgi:hypothetical protein
MTPMSRIQIQNADGSDETQMSTDCEVACGAGVAGAKRPSAARTPPAATVCRCSVPLICDTNHI